MTVVVRPIAAGEAALLREVRLRALRDAPLAFGSTHAHEEGLPMQRWDAWAQEGARGMRQILVLATAAGLPAGSGGSGESAPREDRGRGATREGLGGGRGAARMPFGGGGGATPEPRGGGNRAAEGPAVHPVGLASGVLDDAHRALAHLYAAWVSPEARGVGAGAALVEAVAHWATERGATRLRASVTLGNDAAERLYRRAGFADTGERNALGHGYAITAVLERRLCG